jgi:hypothetical protein
MFKMKEAPMAKESNQVQEIGIVYYTKDLSIFKIIDGNRIPNLSHIRRISGSMKQNGVLMNPIIVNKSFEVIDGQHRLAAAKDQNAGIYYIVAPNYTLKEVHTLNLNQKNWTNKDYMQGYARMGVKPYIKLSEFYDLNNDFTLSDCIVMCSNTSSNSPSRLSSKYRKNHNEMNIKEVFEEGTWKGRDFKLAQTYADQIRAIKKYYDGYKRGTFVGTMLSLFSNDNFDYNRFMHKLEIQPGVLHDCASRAQYKLLIEDIYNYKSREKVNLRY